MQNYYFVATLTAHIELNDEEFDVLLNESANHYDFKVKASTTVGGFLFGLQNRRNFAKEAGKPDNIVDFSERQLNLMMKALEMNNTETGLKLGKKLLAIFKDLQIKTVQVNKPLNDIKFIGHFTGD